MIDREKIAKGIQFCKTSSTCVGCVYAEQMRQGSHLCFQCKLQDDVLELLKEQEAVEPILEQDSMVCGVCGHEVVWQKMLGDGIWADEALNYCPHCGRQVKWQ